MKNTKLNVEELTMVNGGDFELEDLKTAAKLVWGLVTLDPGARAIDKLAYNTWIKPLTR